MSSQQEKFSVAEKVAKVRELLSDTSRAERLAILRMVGAPDELAVRPLWQIASQSGNQRTRDLSMTAPKRAGGPRSGAPKRGYNQTEEVKAAKAALDSCLDDIRKVKKGGLQIDNSLIERKNQLLANLRLAKVRGGFRPSDETRENP
jgi:hypothetical protein